MGRTYKDDRDNLPYKGRRKYNSKRPVKGTKKQSRFGDDPKNNDKPSLFEKDNSIYEDFIVDDYYEGDEDNFEKFTRGK